MRCQLAFHDQSKKRLVLFFQGKWAVFSKTVLWAGGSSCGRLPFTSERAREEELSFQLGKSAPRGMCRSAMGNACYSEHSPGDTLPIHTRHVIRRPATFFLTSALPSKFLLSPTLINIEEAISHESSELDTSSEPKTLRWGGKDSLSYSLKSLTFLAHKN